VVNDGEAMTRAQSLLGVHSSLALASPEAARPPISGARRAHWHGAQRGGVRVHLVIRIRKALHRAVKLYCLNHETTIIEFVIEAIREKLATSTGSWSGSPPMVSKALIDGRPKGLRANPRAHGTDEGRYVEEWTRRPRISSHFSQSSASL
jgi:hypothetical protein